MISPLGMSPVEVSEAPSCAVLLHHGSIFCSRCWKPASPPSVKLSSWVWDWSGDVFTSCEIKGEWSMAFLIGSQGVPAASNPFGSDGCPRPKLKAILPPHRSRIRSLTWSSEAAWSFCLHPPASLISLDRMTSIRKRGETKREIPLELL